MNRRTRWNPVLVTALLLGCSTLTMGAMPAGHARFDETSALVRPEGYREWIFMGAPVTPNELNGGHAAFPEFHHVYIDPDSWKEYVRTGRFRDGTLIVKELVSIGSKAAASGNGYFAGEFIGLEAMVKSAERFPDEPGHWAFFRFTNEEAPDGMPLAERSAPMPTAACNSCHASAAGEDLVFTQYYPTVRAAKP